MDSSSQKNCYEWLLWLLNLDIMIFVDLVYAYILFAEWSEGLWKNSPLVPGTNRYSLRLWLLYIFLLSAHSVSHSFCFFISIWTRRWSAAAEWTINVCIIHIAVAMRLKIRNTTCTASVQSLHNIYKYMQVYTYTQHTLHSLHTHIQTGTPFSTIKGKFFTFHI